jgi:hypothetical protein
MKARQGVGRLTSSRLYRARARGIVDARAEAMIGRLPSSTTGIAAKPENAAFEQRCTAPPSRARVLGSNGPAGDGRGCDAVLRFARFAVLRLRRRAGGARNGMSRPRWMDRRAEVYDKTIS